MGPKLNVKKNLEQRDKLIQEKEEKRYFYILTLCYGPQGHSYSSEAGELSGVENKSKGEIYSFILKDTLKRRKIVDSYAVLFYSLEEL